MHYLFRVFLNRFGLCSIKSRFVQTDLSFLVNVYRNRIDCPYLMAIFGLAVPNRRSRQTGLFHVPFGRVNTVKSGFTVRIPVLCNRFLQHTPTGTADMLASSCSVLSDIREFARSLGTYMECVVTVVCMCCVVLCYLV